MRTLAGFAAVAVFAVVVLSWVFGVVVPPGYAGIRQVTLGPWKGLSTESLPPGYHWSIPIYSKVHLIPTSVQVLNLDRAQRTTVQSSGSVEVQTADGSSVDVDLSVFTRFYEAPGEIDGVKHSGPTELIRKLGPTPISWTTTVGRVAVDEVRQALGRLTTSQFYNPQMRQDQLATARTRMSQRLGEFGIEVDGVLLRRYTYREARIDKAIFEKNLQDQEERLNNAASKLSEALAASEQVSAEMDAKIQTLRVEGENKARVVKSEGDLYEAERTSQGDLAVAKARAEVDRLRAGVLAASSGAEIYVARELAPILSSLKGGVVNDINPYDVDAWIKRLGIRGQAR